MAHRIPRKYGGMPGVYAYRRLDWAIKAAKAAIKAGYVASVSKPFPNYYEVVVDRSRRKKK